jgi:hypothetical protein
VWQEGVARSKHEGHAKMVNKKPVMRKRRNECGGIIMWSMCHQNPHFCGVVW